MATIIQAVSAGSIVDGAAAKAGVVKMAAPAAAEAADARRQRDA
ncbi:hypothetical protein [Bradyrhizobium sp.]|nr:hypothetical protein [Bradyrhizobium sp.]MDU0953895.1 hypothetical protein [Bradyrhizobium sp.]MDU3132470.1 hypothetical protein [Bradyrhizobium sp.]MDU6141562.1 hypothetical protein [Bradyrhizobium sp.]MDU6325314.1 hypothetical protein [Bradyrhizobium sp.]MDU6489445.1 hypothetical protein [Bradyrhizobium sp.]